MRHAKFFAVLVFAALLGYGASGFYCLPMAAFQGDLTRMGMLPESQFGWRKLQPPINPQLIQQVSLQQADVLVIGDSFSDKSIWQTVLAQHGIKVRTERWDSMRGICADFTPWLRAQGFRGRFVVLQLVERNVPEMLENSVACRHMQYHPNSKTDAPRYPPIVSFDVNGGNYDGKFSTGFRTLLNVLKYGRLRKTADFNTWIFHKDVKMARLANGCELFSHANCDDALFLTWDKAAEVEGNALDNIGKLGARLGGITPIWVFVPNKSTAYLYPNKQFWNEAERRFHAPNLLRMTQQAIQEKTIDLYPANNTHFSTEGYLLMGEEILKAIQQAQLQGQR